MMSYVLDTCIFNKLLDGILGINDLPSDGIFFATYIQIDELKATKNSKRREALLLKFTEVTHPTMLPTETFVSDVSRCDHDKVGGGVLFEKLKSALDSMNKSKPNNTQDALIAEVANINNFTLITSDSHLATIAKEHGGKVIYFEISQSIKQEKAKASVK